MMAAMYATDDGPALAAHDAPHADLTARQRNLIAILRGIANDLDRGTRAEQHSAALLKLAADAIERRYDAELTRVGCRWAKVKGK